MKEKCMLVDGNSIINRAFYALPLLTNKEGEYTNGVYGFMNIFFKLYDEESPDYLAVAFDLPRPTFRHEKYGEYKGTRKSMPEEMRPQLPLLKKLLKKMNISIYELEGYEADDILGTLSHKAQALGLETVVVSGDRDLLQLADDDIKIRIPKTKAGKTEVEDYYARDVIEIIGVTPQEYVDVKALMGDASDNIPGVPGIGEKTAVKIIQEYKNIEVAIQNAAMLKPKKASENLLHYREQAILSKELATIVTDAPVPFDLAALKTHELFNSDALAEVRRLEFKSLIPRFVKAGHENESAPSKPASNLFRWVQTRKEASLILDKATKSELAAFRLLTSDGSVIGLSLKYGDDPAAFLLINEHLDENSLKTQAAVFFESPTPKITLDSKKERLLLHKWNIEPENIIFDGVLCGYIINSSQAAYDYNDIAKDFLDEVYPSEEELFGKGKAKKSLAQLNPDEQLRFACLQADVIYRAYPIMLGVLDKNDQRTLYEQIELPLAAVLKDMELLGIKVDRDSLVAFGKNLEGHIEGLVEEIYTLAGEEFNINSPIQLGDILFGKLGLKGTKKTKQGYSTAADVLEKLYHKHPIIPKIIDYRTYAKLKSTYADGLLQVMDPHTDKIHSTFNQTVTTTGRISSTEPNLQNIPVRLELGRQLRKVFVPSDTDYVFMDGDYSQIELRVLAHMSGDETLINAFREGQDIHSLTASQVFHVAFDEVTPRMRTAAKAVNFGIVYGIGAYSLSEDLDITVKEAERYIQGYFEKYPGVKQYMEVTVAQAKQDGYASTIFNRRRFIPELGSSNYNLRSFGERVAMNMPVQGSAADIIKIAMVRVHRRLKEEGLQSKLILQVHDELLLEVKRSELELVRELVQYEMENAVELYVPLTTDLHTAETWYDAK